MRSTSQSFEAQSSRKVTSWGGRVPLDFMALAQGMTIAS
jgi:hypothetical protein